eukprot:364977-Chlamydomonas_euryale.AAC.6
MPKTGKAPKLSDMALWQFDGSSTGQVDFELERGGGGRRVCVLGGEERCPTWRCGSFARCWPTRSEPDGWGVWREDG